MAALKLFTVLVVVAAALVYGQSPDEFRTSPSNSTGSTGGKPAPDSQPDEVKPLQESQPETPELAPEEEEEEEEEEDDDGSDFEESSEEHFEIIRGRTTPFDVAEVPVIAAIPIKEETEHSISAKIREGRVCNNWCYYHRRTFFILRKPSFRCSCYFY